MSARIIRFPRERVLEEPRNWIRKAALGIAAALLLLSLVLETLEIPDDEAIEGLRHVSIALGTWAFQ